MYASTTSYGHRTLGASLLRSLTGGSPFLLDSKDPTGDFHDFLMGEVRYASLVQSFPDEAKRLHAKPEEEYKERWETYKQMAEG